MKNLSIISLLIILIYFRVHAQDLNWRSHSFGDICCNEFARVESISNAANGDVHLQVSYATSPYSFLKSSNNGETWESIFSDFSYKQMMVSAIAERPDGKMVISALVEEDMRYRFHIFIADDPFDSLKYWKKIDNEFPDSLLITSFAVDSSNNIFALTRWDYPAPTQSRIFFLAAGDSQWVDRNNGLPDKIKITSVIPLSNGVILLASLNKGIYRSTDNGISWKVVDSEYKDWNIIAFNINNKGEVFAIINSRAFISKDNGNTWNLANQGLPSGGIWSMTTADNNDLYAFGKDTILYRSTSNGGSWQYYQKAPQLWGGGNYLGIYLILINKAGFLFLTNSSGIISSRNKITSFNSQEKNSEVVMEYSLTQNYPNPFNPSTIIQFEMPLPGFVSIKVYDVLGKEVSTLINDEMSAGHHEIQFSGAELKSGVYFYKMSVEKLSYIKKMVLMK